MLSCTGNDMDWVRCLLKGGEMLDAVAGARTRASAFCTAEPPSGESADQESQVPFLKLPPGFCLFYHGLGLQLPAQQHCCFRVQLPDCQAVMQSCR